MIYCPKCQSPNVRRSHRRGWERLVPFLRFHRCRDCRARFRARRAPFTCCPRCGTADVQSISRERVGGGLQQGRQNPLVLLGLRLLQARAYRCPFCRVHFLDLRALRKGAKRAEQPAAEQAQPAETGAHETHAG